MLHSNRYQTILAVMTLNPTNSINTTGMLIAFLQEGIHPHLHSAVTFDRKYTFLSHFKRFYYYTRANAFPKSCKLLDDTTEKINFAVHKLM